MERKPKKVIQEENFGRKRDKIKLYHNIRPYINKKKLVLEFYKHTKNITLSKKECIEIIKSLKKILEKLE